jgi:hypothetical protein
MNKSLLLIIDLLTRIAGAFTIVYAVGICLWLTEKMFFHTEIRLFNLWVGLIALLSFFLLNLLRNRLRKQ